jgi:hypothetical protein
VCCISCWACDLLPYECRIASKFCCCVLQLACNNLGLKEGMLVWVHSWIMIPGDLVSVLWLVYSWEMQLSLFWVVWELFECCVILLESHFCVCAGMLGNYVLWFGIIWGKQILHFTRNFLSRVTEMQTWPVSGFGIPTIIKCNCNLDFTWQATKRVACLGCDQVCRLCFDTWHFCSQLMGIWRRFCLFAFFKLVLSCW